MLHLLNCWVLDFEVHGRQQRNEQKFRVWPESDREDLESKRGQYLVDNLVDIRTGSTVHWWLAFITTGNCAGSQVQQGDE